MWVSYKVPRRVFWGGGGGQGIFIPKQFQKKGILAQLPLKPLWPCFLLPRG